MRRHRVRLKPPGTPRPARPELPKGKAPGEPETRLERIKRLVAEGDWAAALRLGSTLLRKEPDRTTIQRAWQAMQRPAFTRETGGNPEQRIAAGVETLRRLFATTKGAS